MKSYTQFAFAHFQLTIHVFYISNENVFPPIGDSPKPSNHLAWPWSLIWPLEPIVAPPVQRQLHTLGWRRVQHPPLLCFSLPLCSIRWTRLADRQGLSQRSTSAPLRCCCCCGLKMHEHPIWTAKKESGKASGGHGGAEQHGGSNVVLGLKSSSGGEMRRKLGGRQEGGEQARGGAWQVGRFPAEGAAERQANRHEKLFSGTGEDQGMIN